MTPEEYERIKEAEKEHLRKLKQLKQQVRDLERKKKVADALDDMVKAPGEDILGTHEEMMGKLQEETALREARLEIALEEQGLDAATPAEPAGPSEEELRLSRRIIEAYAAAEAEGKGVVVVDGKLIEKLHVDHAERVVALAEAIALA